MVEVVVFEVDFGDDVDLILFYDWIIWVIEYEFVVEWLNLFEILVEWIVDCILVEFLVMWVFVCI